MRRLTGRESRRGKPELCGGDEPRVRNDQRSLDRVLELPDVSPPGGRPQQLPGVAGQPPLPPAPPPPPGADELADLVEKQRAPGGELEAARLLPIRSGESASFMAEELRLDERFWQRRAVDGDAGAVGATTGIVDRLGHQLLARAALAGQEHGGLLRERLRGPLERLAQAGGLA